MEKLFLGMDDLFETLGLASDPQSIASFIARHSPLDARTRIEDAPFWSGSQSAMLRRAIEDDADWAFVVDQLNALLRH
jgi:hypothetical protein